MKLSGARICVECEEVFDYYRTLLAGTGNARVCPSCLSTSTVLLSRWVQTMAEYEKKGTLDCPVEAA